MSRQVALVTGAASGVGLGVAERLAAAGWHVVMFDRDHSVSRAAEALQASAAQGEIRAVPGDVSCEADVIEAVGACRQLGGLDLAVANAGIGSRNAELPDLTLSEFLSVQAVNVTGTFLTCKHAAAVMREARRGSIVVVSSVMWQAPVPREAAYNATKSAVVGLTQGLALDMAPYGVRANVVAPGAVRTKMHIVDMNRRSVESGLAVEQIEQQDAAGIPLGRLGEPADIADAVLFLASDAASYITGQVLSVNGGLAMHF